MTFRRLIPPIHLNNYGHYQIKTSYDALTIIRGHDIDIAFCSLDPSGLLLLKDGFYWNGPSGGVDTLKTAMPSAVHDCFCELIHLGYLPKECRPAVDENYQRDLEAWGVVTLKRKIHKWAIRLFGPIYNWLNIESPLNKP